MELSLFKPAYLLGEDAALAALKAKASICLQCPLHKERTNVVWGEGQVNSPEIAFVGEAPGRNDDSTGRPFSGQAGELLDKMITSMGFSKSEIYMCNVVLCRPPKNRKPNEREVKACNNFLAEQLRIIRPKMIVALGVTAARALANSTKDIEGLRGRWLKWRDKKSDLKITVRATYHPAQLLRYPDKKEDAWGDLQLVMQWMGK